MVELEKFETEERLKIIYFKITAEMNTNTIHNIGPNLFYTQHKINANAFLFKNYKRCIDLSLITIPCNCKLVIIARKFSLI